MPLTLSHPAAVLPLRRLGLSTSALVLGSMAPDVPVFLRTCARSSSDRPRHVRSRGPSSSCRRLQRSPRRRQLAVEHRAGGLRDLAFFGVVDSVVVSVVVVGLACLGWQLAVRVTPAR